MLDLPIYLYRFINTLYYIYINIHVKVYIYVQSILIPFSPIQRKAKTALYLSNLEFHIFIWTTIVLFKYLYAVFSFILHCWMCCCFSWSSDAPRKQILTFPEGQNTALLWILCNEEKDHRDLLFRKVQSDRLFFYFYLHCMKNKYFIYVK